MSHHRHARTTRNLACIALLSATLACAGAPAAEAPAQDAAPEARKLAYTFEIERGETPEVFVTLELQGSEETQTELSVNRFSGGVEAGGDDIDHLRAFGSDGAELAVERPEPNEWIVTHEPGDALRIAYSIRANEHQDSLDYRVARRPILNDSLFHTGGALFLVVPSELDASEFVDVTLDWEGLEAAGWQAASSFSEGGEPHHMRRRTGELLQSIFLAGEIDVHRFDIKGYPLVVAAQGGWGFDLPTFAELAREIVVAERDFFADYEHPYYLISLIPSGEVQPGSTSYEGTGLTQSFSLMVQRGTTVDEGSQTREGILFLLAHEMFHNWNGVTFGVAQPEELGYWFSEGFTEFYARRLLYDLGWISAERYVESVNESIAGYFTSPVRDEPNARIQADFWNDGDVHKLPYRRGDMIAITADLAIREHSGGEHSLDDVMRELLHLAKTTQNVFTNEELVGLLVKWGGDELGDRVWQLIEAETIPMFDGSELPDALAVSVEPIGGFDLGFNDQLSGNGGVVTGVREGSAAFEAGLRDGQRLAGWSVQYGRVDLPVEIHVDDGGQVRTISYLPQGDPIDIPQFTLVPGESL